MKVVTISKKTYIRYLGEYRTMRTPETVQEVSSTNVDALDIPEGTRTFQFFEKETVLTEDGTKFEAERNLSPAYKLWEPPSGSYKP